jgi:predicted HNH restriction endonuclease
MGEWKIRKDVEQSVLEYFKVQIQNFPEEVNKTMKSLSQNSRLSGRESNPYSTEYKERNMNWNNSVPVFVWVHT